MAAVIDTLRLAKRFREVNVQEAQAELFAEVFREAREADLTQLATKADVAALMSDVAAIEAEMATKREVAAVMTETASIAGLAERRIEFAGMMFALERRFDRLEAKIEVGFAEVRNEIARSRNAQSVLLLPLLLVQTVTLLYLLVRPLLGTIP